MEMQSAIARHPFFEQMKPGLLGMVGAQAREMRFSPGQMIFRQGEPANRFYVILDGLVGLECHAPAHGDIMVQRFGGGEVLGWSWLLAPFTWEFQARAVEATEIIALDGGHLLVMCEQNHELGFELLKRMSKLIVGTLQALRRQLLTMGRWQPVMAPPVPVAQYPVRSASLSERMAEHPFLREFSPEHLAALRSVSMQAHFEPGQLLFKTGDPANRFYLIEQGRVVLAMSPAPERAPLHILGGGDALGWSWLFEPYVWHLDAQSLTSTQAIFFYGTWLREQCELDPDFGFALMKRVTRLALQRLHVTREQLITAVALKERLGVGG